MLGHLECHESFGTDSLQSQLHMHIYELHYQILDCQNKLVVAQENKRCKTKAVY